MIRQELQLRSFHLLLRYLVLLKDLPAVGKTPNGQNRETFEDSGQGETTNHPCSRVHNTHVLQNRGSIVRDDNFSL